jgi:hypothetical protein
MEGNASLNFTVSAVSCSCAALALDRARQGGGLVGHVSPAVRRRDGPEILVLREPEINQCFFLFFHATRQLLALKRKA